MRHHKLTLLGVLLAAVAAFAVSHSFSGTINTPAVATWVDGSGNEIAPYLSFSSAPTSTLYIDSGTGYVWTVQDILTNPTAVGQSLEGIFYTTVNCTGTVYLIEPTWVLPKLVRTGGDPGNFYVAGSAAAVTVHSQYLNGTCYADTETVNIYSSTGPLTAPTLTSAPWHLELR